MLIKPVRPVWPGLRGQNSGREARRDAGQAIRFGRMPVVHDLDADLRQSTLCEEQMSRRRSRKESLLILNPQRGGHRSAPLRFWWLFQRTGTASRCESVV